MTVPGDPLERARGAHDAGRWTEASKLYAEAAVDGMLGPDDVAAHADALWWLGRTDDVIRVGTAAYRAFVDADRVLDAGRMALDLAVIHLLRGDEPLASGWLAKAGRLVEAAPASPLAGYFCHLVEVEGRLESVRCPPSDAAMTPEAAAALDAARRVQDCGRQFRDATLVAAGLNGEGRVLVKLGRRSEGVACLDEAMASVHAGEVDPTFVGYLYCNTMSACHEVVDIGRMRGWTDLTESWLMTMQAAVLFRGICRVHRAQLLVIEGAWDRALEEAQEVVGALADISVSVVAEAWFTIAEVRRLRGERAQAAEAYQRAHLHGRPPQPGLALTMLAAGDASGAFASVRSALLAAADDQLAAAHLHAAMVEIALTADQVDVAVASSAALDATAHRFRTDGLTAMAASARGRVLSAQGRADEALTTLRGAVGAWTHLGARYEAARARCLLAHVFRTLGDDASAHAELDTATEELRRLGAGPTLDHERARSAMAGTADSSGLTARELEVLALVADGRSNRQVADELFISDRTVARHLYNVFNKLGVSSRTEAARHALDHGLVP